MSIKSSTQTVLCFIFVSYFLWSPNGAPCFDFQLGRGDPVPSKIEGSSPGSRLHIYPTSLGGLLPLHVKAAVSIVPLMGGR